MTRTSRPLAFALLFASLACSSLPAQPQQLTATLANGQVELAWGASEGAEQYLVLRGSAGAGPLEELARTAGPVYLDASSIYGQIYYYRVQSLGTAGPSEVSSAVKVAITAAPPTALTAKVSAAGVTLTWNRANGETLGYQILSTAPGSSLVLIGTTTGTSFTDPSPAEGPTTSYFVEGLNPAGPGAPAVASVQTAPAAPQLTATAGSTSAQLSWLPVPGALTYLISRDGASLGVVAGPSYLDSGLALLSGYRYSVQSFNAAGLGGIATVQVRTGPPAPTNVLAAAADTEAIISWDVSPTVDGYRVLRADSPQGPFVPVGGGGSLFTQGSLVDAALSPYQSYWYQVIASQGGGLSTPVVVNVFSLGIAVRSVTSYVTDSGEFVKPDDLSGARAASIVAVLPGRFLASRGTSSGDLVIPFVPSNSYWLRLGSAASGYRFYDTSARSIDLSSATSGRLNLVRATASPTKLDLSLTSLDPWSSADTLELFSYGANDAVFGLEHAGSKTPAAGATALDTTLDLSSCCNLIDTAQGDQVWLLQLLGTTSDRGFPYQTLSKRGLLPGPLQIVNGGEVVLAGSLSTASTAMLSVTYLRSQFKAWAFAVNPAATSEKDLFNLQAAPAYAAHGKFTSGADLILLQTDSGTGDLALGSLSFGLPPLNWDTFLSVQSSFQVQLRAPGATNPKSVSARLTRQDQLGNFSLGAIAPVLSPARFPLVNGADAFTLRTSVGPTPVLSWSQPFAGAATSYSIGLYQISASGPDTSVTLVAQLFTQGLQVTVPDGLLAAGAAYFAVLRVHQDGVQIGQTPLRRSPSESTADLVTNIFRP